MLGSSPLQQMCENYNQTRVLFETLGLYRFVDRKTSSQQIDFLALSVRLKLNSLRSNFVSTIFFIFYLNVVIAYMQYVSLCL